VAVVLGAANVTGGYVITERILQMFDQNKKKPKKRHEMVDFSFLIEPVYIATIHHFHHRPAADEPSPHCQERDRLGWRCNAPGNARHVRNPGLTNIALIAIAIVIGGGLGYIAAKRVAMTDMPQMVAIYNGMAAVRRQGSRRSISSIPPLQRQAALPS